MRIVQKKKRQPGKPVKFGGWILGNEEDYQILRELGVDGLMLWERQGEERQGKKGIFTHCEITSDIVEHLMNEYPAFWPGSFTGLREDGEQTLDQPLWRLGHDILVKEYEEGRGEDDLTEVAANRSIKEQLIVFIDTLAARYGEDFSNYVNSQIIKSLEEAEVGYDGNQTNNGEA